MNCMMGAFFPSFLPTSLPQQHNPVCGALSLRLGYEKEDSKTKELQSDTLGHGRMVKVQVPAKTSTQRQ